MVKSHSSCAFQYPHTSQNLAEDDIFSVYKYHLFKESLMNGTPRVEIIHP